VAVYNNAGEYFLQPVEVLGVLRRCELEVHRFTVFSELLG